MTLSALLPDLLKSSLNSARVGMRLNSTTFSFAADCSSSISFLRIRRISWARSTPISSAIRSREDITDSFTAMETRRVFGWALGSAICSISFFRFVVGCDRALCAGDSIQWSDLQNRLRLVVAVVNLVSDLDGVAQADRGNINAVLRRYTVAKGLPQVVNGLTRFDDPLPS